MLKLIIGNVCAVAFAVSAGGQHQPLEQSAPVATLPEATAVAGKIGQTVEFRDEVKAVSFSKSTNGYYLSFGSPYPHQVLSVWIPAKVYDRLPAHRAMVGRRVHITGPLESSSSGPLLKLEYNHQNFVLEPVDKAVLSKPTLDGKQDRTQFESAVYRTFKDGDYDTVEMLGNELRKSRERLNDGSWLSEAYFAAFRLRPRAPTERYKEMDRGIARWEAAHPASAVLPMVKIGFRLDLAWKWRGNGYANTVTPEGWAGFKRELATAHQILEMNSNDKSYPEYYALMQTVALGEGWPKDKYMGLFNDALQIADDYYRFYYNTAWYLMPQWHGRKGEWEAFAEQMRAQHGAGADGDGLYARIVLSKRNDYKNIFQETAASWDITASGLEYLIRQYPESRSLKNLYANLAWKQHDRARLQRALPAVQDDPDMSVWVNLENVGLAKKFSDSSSIVKPIPSKVP